MEKILNSINTRLKYITTNANNQFILKSCKVIDIKLDDIRKNVIKTEKLLNEVCDRIIFNDIDKMKRVSGETNMVYKKMDELTDFINQLRENYFK